MIPFGNYTVTLMRFSEKGFEKHTLTGCSWRSRITRALVENSTMISENTTCRVPQGQVRPMPGDMMVLGEVEGSAGGEIEMGRLEEKLRGEGRQVFRVQACADNTSGPMPHYAATGA